jgi:hypothetical protein
MDFRYLQIIVYDHSRSYRRELFAAYVFELCVIQIFHFKDGTIFASLTSDIPKAIFINFPKYDFMNHRTRFKYRLGANAF